MIILLFKLYFTVYFQHLVFKVLQLFVRGLTVRSCVDGIESISYHCQLSPTLENEAQEC